MCLHITVGLQSKTRFIHGEGLGNKRPKQPHHVGYEEETDCEF